MINEFYKKGYNENRWLIRYFNFIEKFGRNRYEKNYERHHILPKFIFPEYKNFSNNPWNSIYLSQRAHFIAHYILAKACENSMWRAIVYIGDSRGFGKNLKSRLYQEAKTKANLILSERQKGDGNVAKRPEVRAKISISQKEYYKNNPGPNKGKKASEITKQKQSIAAKNRKQPNRRKKYNLISPDGSIYICEGSLKKTVNELELSLNTLKSNINCVVPKVSEYRKQYNTPIRARTTGWLLTEVQ